MQSVRLALVVLALASLAAAGGLHRRSPNAFQKNAVKFHFFHTGNWLSQTGITLPTEYSQEDILNCKFDPKLKTVVIIHGFAVSVKGNSMQTLKNAYFTGYGRLNLIVLDWSALNPAPFYPLYATGNISGTGKILAALLDFLVQEGLLDMAKVHVLGHSLGAHVAGVAGENVVNGRIGRITGLDPARPLINIADPVGSLSPDDATLVDVLHSNAGILGSMPSLGDIDFYPNGGKAQPGCDGLFGFVCSHSRSYYLWAESIVNPQAFRAWRCQDEWDALHLRCPETNVHAYMGEHISFSQAGDYFVETNAQSPFGLNLTSSQASS